MIRGLAAGVALAGVFAGAAQAAPATTWVGHLLEQARRRHPELTSAAAYTASGPGKPLTLAGASGAPSAPGVPEGAMSVVSDGRTIGAPGAVLETLRDASGDTIGVLRLTFRSGSAASDARVAVELRRALSHHLISANNAADPYPYDAGYKTDMYAQSVVDRAVARHPEVIIMAIHATPEGSKQNIIMGSTIGRIGKKADEDDARVIDKGETNLEISTNGKRFEAELPLNDAKGRRIGAIGVVTVFRAGDDKETLHRRALVIRDELAREIPDAAALSGRGRSPRL